MPSLDDIPASHALFSTDAPLDAELRRMLEWVRVIRDSNASGDALDDAHRVPTDAASPLLECIRRGEVPPVALEVLAGLTGMIQTKDYRMLPLWAAAWALNEPLDAPPEVPLLTQEESADLDRLEGSFGAKAAEQVLADLQQQLAEVNRKIAELEAKQREAETEQPHLAKYIRAQKAGPRVRDLRRGHEPESGTPPPAEHQSTAARVALMGIDGARRFSAREARPILWRYRNNGPVWAALCAALDAVGAASHAGLERLGALADAHPDSPSITWLDEIACRVARNDRAAARAARLDALLASGALGQNAPDLVYVLEHAREDELEKNGTAIHDAWLRLGALHRPATQREDPRDQASPAQLAAIRRGAKKGLSGAVAIVAMDAFYDRLVAEEQREMDLEGPFHGLDLVPPEVDEMLDRALHYLMHGFRETYALELLRGAVPRLSAWMAEGG